MLEHMAFGGPARAGRSATLGLCTACQPPARKRPPSCPRAVRRTLSGRRAPRCAAGAQGLLVPHHVAGLLLNTLRQGRTCGGLNAGPTSRADGLAGAAARLSKMCASGRYDSMTSFSVTSLLKVGWICEPSVLVAARPLANAGPHRRKAGLAIRHAGKQGSPENLTLKDGKLGLNHDLNLHGKLDVTVAVSAVCCAYHLREVMSVTQGSPQARR